MEANIHNILVLSTASSMEEAESIADSLVEEGLAACVQLIPNLRSVYRWQGKIQKEEEILVLVKSQKKLFQSIKKKIQELHSYDVPEIVALPITDGSKEYLDWISQSVR